MVVRIRLARHGTRNNPFYHIVAIADHKPRNALPIEKLGEYDPIPRPVLARPSAAPAYAVASPNAVGSSKSALPLEAYLGSKGSSSSGGGGGSGKDVYDTGGRRIGSGLPKKEDIAMEKRIEWNTPRIQHWLSKGAQPSKPVARMLDRVSALGWDVELPREEPFAGVLTHPHSHDPTGRPDPARRALQGHLADARGADRRQGGRGEGARGGTAAEARRRGGAPGAGGGAEGRAAEEEGRRKEAGTGADHVAADEQAGAESRGEKMRRVSTLHFLCITSRCEEKRSMHFLC